MEGLYLYVNRRFNRGAVLRNVNVCLGKGGDGCKKKTRESWEGKREKRKNGVQTFFLAVLRNLLLRVFLRGQVTAGAKQGD